MWRGERIAHTRQQPWDEHGLLVLPRFYVIQSEMPAWQACMDAQIARRGLKARIEGAD
ncbi:hypothetical protein [Tahibacter amnicola]|uniref:Uncharacterized protein n=1 Tax=Tahibacter amnicola TaxID=2976241 RepID=A0ABY6BQF2_9GAMM|nr:hypothetical protein [Tahibacter amnicola]UXI70002.1 hypothetical protein N4264_10355 [Tahibacter amnicola]